MSGTVRIVKEEWQPRIESEELSDGSVSFFAWHPEAPGVDAMGSTEQEARERWLVNMMDYAADQVAHGARAPAFTHVQFEATGTLYGEVISFEARRSAGAVDLPVTMVI